MPPKHLKKKPIYAEDTYTSIKETDYSFINELRKYYPEATARQAVNENFNDLEDDMVQYGMEKFCHLLIGAIYMAEHGESDEDVFYSLSIDLADIDTGEYDYLFSEDDLKIIKNDIEYIRPFLEEYR